MSYWPLYSRRDKERRTTLKALKRRKALVVDGEDGGIFPEGWILKMSRQ